jgi:hypothetical protein
MPGSNNPSGTNTLQDPSDINRLALRVTTGNVRGAGTDNAVYFDIGPIGWKLGKAFHNDFEKGSTFSYELELPEGVHLTTEDILWYRLHKKGVFGFSGFGDGVDGAWNPERVTLIVNDHDYKTLNIKSPLNSKCWYWRSFDPDDLDLNIFAHSLRFTPNKSLKLVDKVTGILTTNAFKKRGISGWLSNPKKKECDSSGKENVKAVPMQPICVTGQVVQKGKSTDGLETIDLRVSEIESCVQSNEICSRRLAIDTQHGFRQPRYLRAENRMTHNRVHRGEIARICGDVLWDTDREGWWELHPRTNHDLPPFSK